MNNQRVSPCCLASMTLWMQNGYFTRLRKTAQCKCLLRNLLERPLWRGCRSIRHTLGDQLRASAQRSVERKGSRKTPPDSPGNPQHLRITQLPGVVVKLDAAMRTLHSHMIGWRQLGQDTVVSVRRDQAPVHSRVEKTRRTRSGAGTGGG